MSRRRPLVMDEGSVWSAIDRERLDLADLLETLSVDEIDAPSLCPDWRVRDVAAHLALAHMSLRQAGIAIVRAGGSFDRMIRDTAVRHADVVPMERIAAEIRGMAGSRRRAPGVTHLEPLLDVLVHGQDIAIPLGLRRVMPPAAAVAAASRVWTLRWPLSSAFPHLARMRNLRLVATDTDWSVGSGPLVEGPIQALLLLLTGRSALVHQLTGAGAERLLPLKPTSSGT